MEKERNLKAVPERKADAEGTFTQQARVVSDRE